MAARTMDLHSTPRLAQPEDIDALIALDAIARHAPQRRSFIAQAIASRQCWVAAVIFVKFLS
jgi:hypothetical protein